MIASAALFSLSRLTIASTDRDEPTIKAVSIKPDYRDASALFPSPRLTREPWKAFDPLESPSIGEEEEEGEGFEGNADRRLEWFLSQRTYPFDELPVNARDKAWKDRVDGVYRTAGGVPLTWRSIGPRPTNSDFPANWGNTSGRINAIAVSPSDPNVLLVGAATGGVWRSADGGVNFSPVSDSQVDLAVGSIAFAPSDPPTLPVRAVRGRRHSA